MTHHAVTARTIKADLIEGFAGHVRAYQNAADTLTHAAAERLGLNRTDHRCLDIIQREGPIAAGDLARTAGLTAKAITTVIDHLERAGFAERVADDRDRRRVLVSVTTGGQRRAEQIYAPTVRASRDLLQRYTAADLELLLDYLDRSRELLASSAARLRADSADGADGEPTARQHSDAPNGRSPI